MRSCVFFTVVFIAAANAYLEPPPTTASPDTIQDCSYWAVVASTDTCEGIASQNGITLTQFQAYNPSIATTCNLVDGNSYCTEQNYGVPPPVTTATTSSASPTSTGNGITTPTPTQDGMVSNCNIFYFVKSGDECGRIATTYDISIDNFYAWNPAIGKCVSLWANTYVCVGTVTSAPTTTGPPTSTTTGNGIATPTPILPGMVSNCDLFEYVDKGETCDGIATARGVSVADIVTFNPAVEPDCSGLWAEYYICVSIIGHTPSTTPTTTKPPTSTTSGNGIATPTPILPGMVSNCDLFEYVDKGETCDGIARARGVSVADIVTFNPAVEADCSGLWAEYYICVSIIGHTPTTLTTSTRPTTTLPGNGVTTPTPTQQGMVSNCKTFEYVDQGETCATIVEARGITVAQFVSWNPAVGSDCTLMWLNSYVCVGLL